MKSYEPELGQMAFGQPTQQLKVSQEVESAMTALANAWDVMSSTDNPFSNTAAQFNGSRVRVHAYSWGENAQPWNLAWRDFRVSWYKYCGRGMSMNRETCREEMAELLADALADFREKHNA